MSRIGIFQIPSEFRDEDKWFKYFTKKQAIVIVVTILADYRIIASAANLGLLLPAIIFCLFLSFVSIGIVLVKFPVDSLFYYGGGLTLDQWLLRILLRKINRVIYTSHYQRGEGE